MRPTTDKDALVASQIAYMNIEEKDKKSQYKWTKYTISNWDFI